MLSDAQVWQHWLQWLSTAAPDDPALMLGQYRAKLLEAGGSEAEAGNRLAAVLRLMATQTDGWRAFFNKIYANPSPGFNTNPNAFLASAVTGRAPGRALDVCTGQGRNAVFLAVLGWEVTAIDVSDKGLESLQRNAERAGVQVRTVLTSNDAFDLGTAAWDLMVMTYAPVLLTAPGYVKRISDALRPGGLVVIESTASDATNERRTPVDIVPADLRRAFAGFRIPYFAETIATSDWQEEEARLVRLIAEKQRDTTAAA